MIMIDASIHIDFVGIFQIKHKIILKKLDILKLNLHKFLLPEFHSEDLDRESLLRIIEKTVIPIIRVQRYINENFSRKITTEQLLRESLFCQTAFFKAFKRVFGIRASY